VKLLNAQQLVPLAQPHPAHRDVMAHSRKDAILAGLAAIALVERLCEELAKVERGEQTIWECYEAQWKHVQASTLAVPQ
jgi:hypothetical protein